MEAFGIQQIEGSWIKTIRFYSDTIWLTYSNAGMIPLLGMMVYRFFRPIQNVESYEKAENFKKQAGYLFEKFLTFYAFYYYILDMTLTLIEGTVFQTCRFAYFSHHLVSLPLLYYTQKLNYMPWWTIAIAGFHALLLAFPHTQILNYPYLALIVYFHYMAAFVKPFNTMNIYQGISRFYVGVYIILIIIWYTDCKNILPFL